MHFSIIEQTFCEKLFRIKFAFEHFAKSICLTSNCYLICIKIDIENHCISETQGKVWFFDTVFVHRIVRNWCEIAKNIPSQSRFARFVQRHIQTKFCSSLTNLCHQPKKRTFFCVSLIELQCWEMVSILYLDVAKKLTSPFPFLIDINKLCLFKRFG